jgi:methionine-rich copper-binding protein CopC
MIAALAAFGVLAVSPAALAHTKVQKTSIADNARLASSPASFTMEFSARTSLVKVTLAGAKGQAIPLAYVPPKDASATFTIPLPALTAGAYTLSWKTLSKDGHAVNGAVHFTVTGS